MTFLRSP